MFAFPVMNNRESLCPQKVGNYARVSKHTARKLFYDGFSIFAIPCKLMPFTKFAFEALLVKGEIQDFDTFVSAFEAANCTWETGYYTTFYSFANQITQNGDGTFTGWRDGANKKRTR